ncbi:hypothetical protein J6P92_05285, partial [bacterium]|nr:hypothetical protein [bacterium]
KAKTGANLSLSTETDNVGLILADGASIILNYNPATDPIDVGDKVVSVPEEGKSLPVGNGKSKLFPYTTTVTNGIDFVMDVNGGKKPNSEVAGRARDIRSFKTAQFSKGDPCVTKYGKGSIYVEGYGCVLDVGSYNYLSANTACSDKGMTLIDSSTFPSIRHSQGLPTSGTYWISNTYDGSNAKCWDFQVGHDIWCNAAYYISRGALCLGN